LLYNYGHYYSEASKLPIIAEGDILQIDSNGQNKAGRMESSDLVRFSIPEGGRIVVFSPELSLAYDSLMSDSPETYVKGVPIFWPSANREILLKLLILNGLRYNRSLGKRFHKSTGSCQHTEGNRE
jgi:hypothetical protein